MLSLYLVAIGCLIPVTGFVQLSTFHRTTADTTSSLQVSWWDQDEESRRSAMENNILRTDVRNFLTQRSLQSFMHLCIQCRDPHTVKWLEDFGGFQNLENFHGTGGLNTTIFPKWSSLLLDMMEQPQDVVVVSVRRRGRGTGGWSKNNPYLEDRFVEFEIDIDPPSLANRILSVREQIASEWVSDLNTLKISNDMVFDSYNEKAKEARKNEQEHCDDDDEKEDTSIDCLTSKENRPKVAFDRQGMTLLRNADSVGDRASSPLRRRSFDLLALLATQESIHRVLREYVDAGKEREVSFHWFRDFYVERLPKFFDGHQELGRGDDFLEELLLTSPAIKSDGDGNFGLVDPLRIAEDVLSTRGKVAMEWKDIVSVAKEEHTEIRKVIFEKQMLKWGQTPLQAVSQEPKVEKRTSVADEKNIGEFQ